MDTNAAVPMGGDPIRHRARPGRAGERRLPAEPVRVTGNTGSR